jgi:hypothetical protein
MATESRARRPSKTPVSETEKKPATLRLVTALLGLGQLVSLRNHPQSVITLLLAETYSTLGYWFERFMFSGRSLQLGFIEVKFQQRYQMRHRNSRSEDLCRRVASAVYEPVGSTPSPPHSLSGGMIALNHPDRSAIESALPANLIRPGSPSLDRPSPAIRTPSATTSFIKRPGMPGAGPVR